jgi:hypothetical protein
MANEVFPKNNIAPDSAYWAREVERRIKVLEADLARNKKGNLVNASAATVSSASISALWFRIAAIEAAGGTAGTGGAYTHTQTVPSTTWTITHNLGFNPNVTIIDAALNNIEGDIQYNSINELSITFSVEVYGTAYLS